MSNTIEYVVHGDAVYEESDWDSSGDSERYDDVIRCSVNIDHPDYPDDGEKVYEDLANWWATGVKPTYAL